MEPDTLNKALAAADKKLNTILKSTIHTEKDDLGEDLVERVAKALENVLLDIDFMIERGLLPDIRDDMIYVEARAAIAAIGRT